jgi:hypothetical protein
MFNFNFMYTISEDQFDSMVNLTYTHIKLLYSTILALFYYFYHG